MSLTFAFNSSTSKIPRPPKPGIFMHGKNGSAVVLIHGLTGTPTEVRFIAWYLNNCGFTVSCPRLANHGEPIDVLKSTRWQEFYSSARQAYLEVREKHERVFTAGLSMGALLGLLLADEFQSGVAGVSCLSPTLFYDGWNVPWYQCLLPLASLTPLGNYVYFKERPPYGLKNERVRKKVDGFYRGADIHDMGDVDRLGYPYFPLRLLGELRRLVAHLQPRLSRIVSPCQVIQARHDDMSSVKNAVRVHEAVRSARKEIVYLEDSYHVITADQERGKVAQSMLRFFNEGVVHA